MYNSDVICAGEMYGPWLLLC